jgi:hypothetical protein
LFYQKRYDCRPHTPCIPLKGGHFDTTEVIEAEWQAVLNTFTELDFQDAFKGAPLWVIVARISKVIFFLTRWKARKLWTTLCIHVKFSTVRSQ